MRLREKQLIFANSEELDRLALNVGYKRKGVVFKESDFDFRHRLIKLNQKYLCSHDQTGLRRNIDHDLVCNDCGLNLG